MSEPYRTTPAEPAKAPNAWRIYAFDIGDNGWLVCPACRTKHGRIVGYCEGRRLGCRRTLMCPATPHLHICCGGNGNSGCGYRWLMATAEQPEAREVAR
jgi:hypothetical protein